MTSMIAVYLRLLHSYLLTIQIRMVTSEFGDEFILCFFEKQNLCEIYLFPFWWGILQLNQNIKDRKFLIFVWKYGNVVKRTGLIDGDLGDTSFQQNSNQLLAIVARLNKVYLDFWEFRVRKACVGGCMLFYVTSAIFQPFATRSSFS